MCDTVFMVEGLWWDGEDAEYIRRRGERYSGARGIEPKWTLEAAADSARIIRDPDPKSHVGAIRLIGYSHSAGFVITIIVDPVNYSGITAWKTSGSDLRKYLEDSR